MKHLGYLQTVLVFCFLIAPFTFAQTSASGKVRFVLGEVTQQKKGVGNWNPLRVGAKVAPKDLIKTLVESEVGIALIDGSILTIEENSLVILTEAIKDSKLTKTTVNIQSGKLFFDVQKQKKANSLEFKTGTATAAIRGTSGFIGQTHRGIMLSLESGKMLVTSVNGDSIEVNEGETLIQDGEKGFKKFKTRNSGSKQLASILETQINKKDYSEAKLIQEMKSLDASTLPKMDSLEKNVPCTFVPLPEFVTDNFVIFRGQCPLDVALSINSSPIEIKKGGVFNQKFSWDATTFGTKKFSAKCEASHIQFACGKFNVQYGESTPNSSQGPSSDAPTGEFLFIKTESPAKICKQGSVTIEGSFATTDTAAQLNVFLGNKKSPNLFPVSVNGNFVYSFSISDIDQNWNEKQIKVVLKTENRTFVDSLMLDIDKRCKEVNLKAPKFEIKFVDSLKCEAAISITETTGDVVLLSRMVDGIPESERAFTQDKPDEKFTLKKGSHRYTLTAEDLAGNRSTVTKDMGCYPPTAFYIQMDGNAKEIVNVPSGADRLTGIPRTVRFRIKNIPGNDSQYLSKLELKRNGQTVVTFRGSQIDRLDYEFPIELVREETTQYEFIVTSKNGSTRKATKTYEVRNVR